MIGKIILPWFGGSAAVWSTCLLFFQASLLAGYLYAHFSTRYLKPRQQALLHIALLAVSIALLPILPSPNWKPAQRGRPLRPHPAASHRNHRSALLSAVHHQPVAPSLVCGGQARSDPLSPVRAFEFRIAAGPAQLSAGSGTACGDAHASVRMVRDIRLVRAFLRGAGVERAESRHSERSLRQAAAHPAGNYTRSGSRWRPAAPRCCFPSPLI